MSSTIRTIALPFGERMPALGLGTWHIAEDPARRQTELAALERGLDLGLTLIDTAEMYGDGAAVELVGEAIAGRRDDVFLGSNDGRGHRGRRELRRSGPCRSCHEYLKTK